MSDPEMNGETLGSLETVLDDFSTAQTRHEALLLATQPELDEINQTMFALNSRSSAILRQRTAEMDKLTPLGLRAASLGEKTWRDTERPMSQRIVGALLGYPLSRSDQSPPFTSRVSGALTAYKTFELIDPMLAEGTPLPLLHIESTPRQHIRVGFLTGYDLDDPRGRDIDAWKLHLAVSSLVQVNPAYESAFKMQSYASDSSSQIATSPAVLRQPLFDPAAIAVKKPKLELKFRPFDSIAGTPLIDGLMLGESNIAKFMSGLATNYSEAARAIPLQENPIYFLHLALRRVGLVSEVPADIVSFWQESAKATAERLTTEEQKTRTAQEELELSAAGHILETVSSSD